MKNVVCCVGGVIYRYSSCTNHAVLKAEAEQLLRGFRLTQCIMHHLDASYEIGRCR